MGNELEKVYQGQLVRGASKCEVSLFEGDNFPCPAHGFASRSSRNFLTPSASCSVIAFCRASMNFSGSTPHCPRNLSKVFLSNSLSLDIEMSWYGPLEKS